MHRVFVEMMPRPILSAAACAVRKFVAGEARTLRDAVRAADLPLPITAVAASVCSLVIVVAGPSAS
jgi:hypothetical protein